jgi:hypothetical protein
MVQDVVIVAAGVFEGVGENRQAVEGAVCASMGVLVPV